MEGEPLVGVGRHGRAQTNRVVRNTSAWGGGRARPRSGWHLLRREDGTDMDEHGQAGTNTDGRHAGQEGRRKGELAKWVAPTSGTYSPAPTPAGTYSRTGRHRTYSTEGGPSGGWR
jgi:hypothetical protein